MSGRVSVFFVNRLVFPFFQIKFEFGHHDAPPPQGFLSLIVTSLQTKLQSVCSHSRLVLMCSQTH